MKKIICWAQKIEHMRTFAPILEEAEKAGFASFSASPAYEPAGVVTVGKKITFTNNKEFAKRLGRLKPDIWLQCGLGSRYMDVLKKHKAKVVYVSHGIAPDHKYMENVYKKIYSKTANRFNALFVQADEQKDMFIKYAGVKHPDRIHTNCMPQLDLIGYKKHLFDSFNEKDKTFNRILEHRNNGKKIVIFMLGRLNYVEFYSKESNYAIAKYIKKNVDNHNCVFLIKEKVAGDLEILKDNSGISFEDNIIPIKSDDLWYRFQDVIDAAVMSDPSTFEVEFCLLNKRLVIYNEKYVDLFGSVENGNAILLDNLEDLFDAIEKDGPSVNNSCGVLHDGLAAKRIMEVISEI